jgi:hypothetical protein
MSAALMSSSPEPDVRPSGRPKKSAEEMAAAPCGEAEGEVGRAERPVATLSRALRMRRPWSRSCPATHRELVQLLAPLRLGVGVALLEVAAGDGLLRGGMAQQVRLSAWP